MSVRSEIDRISGNIAGAYAAVEEKGGALPSELTSGNLPAAIRNIPAASAYGAGKFVAIPCGKGKAFYSPVDPPDGKGARYHA